MATVNISRALAECLEALQERGEELESCLERYPQYREELRPLLELAIALRSAPVEAQPSPMFILRLKDQIVKGTARKQTAPKGGEAYRRQR